MEDPARNVNNAIAGAGTQESPVFTFETQNRIGEFVNSIYKTSSETTTSIQRSAAKKPSHDFITSFHVPSRHDLQIEAAGANCGSTGPYKPPSAYCFRDDKPEKMIAKEFETKFSIPNNQTLRTTCAKHQVRPHNLYHHSRHDDGFRKVFWMVLVLLKIARTTLKWMGNLISYLMCRILLIRQRI